MRMKRVCPKCGYKEIIHSRTLTKTRCSKCYRKWLTNAEGNKSLSLRTEVSEERTQ